MVLDLLSLGSQGESVKIKFDKRNYINCITLYPILYDRKSLSSQHTMSLNTEQNQVGQK